MFLIKFIDKDLILELVKEMNVIVIVEEYSIIGGLGFVVSEVVGEFCLIIVKKVGIKDIFGEFGILNELLKKYELICDDIVKIVKEVIIVKRM